MKNIFILILYFILYFIYNLIIYIKIRNNFKNILKIKNFNYVTIEVILGIVKKIFFIVILTIKASVYSQS